MYIEKLTLLFLAQTRASKDEGKEFILLGKVSYICDRRYRSIIGTLSEAS